MPKPLPTPVQSPQLQFLADCQSAGIGAGLSLEDLPAEGRLFYSASYSDEIKAGPWMDREQRHRMLKLIVFPKQQNNRALYTVFSKDKSPFDLFVRERKAIIDKEKPDGQDRVNSINIDQSFWPDEWDHLHLLEQKPKEKSGEALCNFYIGWAIANDLYPEVSTRHPEWCKKMVGCYFGREIWQYLDDDRRAGLHRISCQELEKRQAIARRANMSPEQYLKAKPITWEEDKQAIDKIQVGFPVIPGGRTYKFSVLYFNEPEPIFAKEMEGAQLFLWVKTMRDAIYMKGPIDLEEFRSADDVKAVCVETTYDYGDKTLVYEATSKPKKRQVPKIGRLPRAQQVCPVCIGNPNMLTGHGSDEWQKEEAEEEG